MLYMFLIKVSYMKMEVIYVHRFMIIVVIATL